MKKVLSLALIPAAMVLGSCNQSNPPYVQTIGISVPAEVLAACGIVVWTESALNWKSDTELNAGQVLQRTDFFNVYLPTPAGTQAGKTLNISQPGIYTVFNSSSSSPYSTLNSSLTCTKTGQVVTATSKLGSYSNSGGLGVSLGTDGKLSAVWTIF